MLDLLFKVFRWLDKRRVAIAWVILGIAIAGAVSVTARHAAHVTATKLYTAQVQGCYRANDTRRLVNVELKAAQLSQSVNEQFLSDAAAARVAAYKITHVANDLQTARKYEHLLQLQRRVEFTPLAIVNCKEVIPRP